MALEQWYFDLILNDVRQRLAAACDDMTFAPLATPRRQSALTALLNASATYAANRVWAEAALCAIQDDIDAQIADRTWIYPKVDLDV